MGNADECSYFHDAVYLEGGATRTINSKLLGWQLFCGSPLRFLDQKESRLYYLRASMYSLLP